MRNVTFVITLAALAALLSTGAVEKRETAADLDADGRQETVFISKNSASKSASVVVMRGKKKVWEGVRLNPWKVAVPDVDGDGKHEVAVGVYKKSRFDPVMAKRLFIYKFEANKLLPKWLGSRLGRRFTDFRFTDLNKDGKDELIANEYDDKWRYESTYRWNGFGFDFIKDKKVGKKSK
jgi:hypothetical protein